MKFAYNFMLFLLVLALFACKEENQSPVISFVTPAADTLLDRSGRVHFEVNARDPDGGIRNVDFYLNDDLDPKIDPSAPYDAFFDFDSDEHDGTNIITAIVFDNEGEEALVQRKVIMSDFRNKWLGNYEGEARRYSAYPVAGHGLYFDPDRGDHLYDVNSTVVKHDSDYDRIVVNLANSDSSLYIDDIKIDSSGTYKFEIYTTVILERTTWTFVGDSLHIIHLLSYLYEGDLVHQYGLKRVD